MGVEQKCAAYTGHREEWSLVRDAIAGEKAIKAGGQTYLPRPSGMDDDEYKAYGARAHFFGATGRTAEGLHGMVFKKPPVLADCPPKLQALLEDVDRQGTNLDQFASDLVWDTLPTNWGGILVDYPQTEEGMDKATSDRLGFRTYAAWYSAESIINWRFSTKNNQRVLSLVVLLEPYERAMSDEFSTETKNRYRVLDLDENGIYRQRLFDDAKAEGLSVPVSEYFPKKQNQQLDYIPFFTFPGREPEKSMIYDLACENVGHYQKTADYENGLHLTGIPTPYATCPAPLDEKGSPVEVHLGGNNFIWLGDPSASADFLEFTGQGLATSEKAIQNCEERMAILGARIISAEKKGVESAESARIHRAGENSVLASFALNASDVLTAVIREIASWEGIPGAEKTTYKLNTEYDISQMNPQLFTAWTTARLNGEIPRSVYFAKLQANGDISPEVTFEDWLKELDSDAMDHGTDGDGGDDGAPGGANGGDTGDARGTTE